MLFTIIIPAYNEEILLPACLDSLKKQTMSHEDYEIIVIDNGSNDKTTQIAEQFGVKLLIDETKNVSGLRNLGAKYSKGKVLAFIDADCTASSDWLNSASKYIDDTSVSAWGAPPNVPKDATWVQKSWYHIRRKQKNIMNVDWLESMNVFVSKETFLSIGGFNEKLITSEDVDFGFRVGNLGKIISDDKIKVIHFGEARTIREFIKKEMWRGVNNYEGVFSHGLKFSELPSLMVPIYFILFIPVLIALTTFSISPLMPYLLLFAFIVPSLLIVLILLKKKLSIIEHLKLQLLVYIYFLVRSVAAVKGGIKKLLMKVKNP